jgi:hypothetical protein
MQYAVPGTRHCMYGHSDLEGAGLPINETRVCPGEGTCGTDIAYYMCTCISRSRALAAYSASGSWAGFGVLLFFGVMLLGRFSCHTCCRKEADWTDDIKRDRPRCFKATLVLAFALPFALFAGGIYFLLLALRDPKEAQGYWTGCGISNPLNPANSGNAVLWGVLGTVFGLPFLGLCVVFALDKWRETREASGGSGGSTRPPPRVPIAELTTPIGLARAVSKGTLRAASSARGQQLA